MFTDEECLNQLRRPVANDVRTQKMSKGFNNSDAANAARMGRHFMQMTGMR